MACEQTDAVPACALLLVHAANLNSKPGAGFLLYLLDLSFRLAQWMNLSMVRGRMMPDNSLSLELSFLPVQPAASHSIVMQSL